MRKTIPSLDRNKSILFNYIIYIALIIALGLVYFTRSQGYAIDDSYITFRYAYHLKEGYGLAFNVGEAYYGTTAAGYATLLAALSSAAAALVGLFSAGPSELLEIPSISSAMAALAITTMAALLPVLAMASRNWRLWLLATLAAAFLFIAGPFNEFVGHETYPYLAIALLGTVLLAYRQAYVAGALLLAVAATFRPDALLLAGIVPVLDWLRSGLTLGAYLRSSNAIRFVLVYALACGAWHAYLTWHFGSPIPGTMAAKKAQVALGHWPLYTPATLFAYLTESTGKSGIALALIGIAGLLVGIGRSCIEKSEIRPEAFVATIWLTFGVFSALAYFSFHVTFWRWYGVPILFSFFIAAFVGWSDITRWSLSAGQKIGKGSKLPAYIFGALPIALIFTLLIDKTNNVTQWKNHKNTNDHIHAYSEIVDYIKQDSPEGASIEIAEPGSLGYHLGPKYHVVDELGLISPGVAQALQRGDYSWAMNKWRPKYLVCSWVGKYSACFHKLQEGAYEPIGEFNREFWRKSLNHGAILYRRKEPSGH